MFGSYFLKLFLRTVFGNIETTFWYFLKTILIYRFSVFCPLFVFQTKNKIGTKLVLYIFLVFLIIENSFLKNRNQTSPNLENNNSFQNTSKLYFLYFQIFLSRIALKNMHETNMSIGFHSICS